MITSILITLLVCSVITVGSIFIEEAYYSRKLPPYCMKELNKKLKMIDECLSEETDYKQISFLLESKEYWLNEKEKLKKHLERNRL